MYLTFKDLQILRGLISREAKVRGWQGKHPTDKKGVTERATISLARKIWTAYYEMRDGVR